MNKLYLPRRAILFGTALLLAACVIPPAPSNQLNEELAAPPSASQGDPTQSTGDLTAAQRQLLAGLPILGAAPELQNSVWFNSEPLQLANLSGKVVMIEFWTYG